MKSYKQLLNELAEDPALRELTDEESEKLRRTLMTAFQDLAEVCGRHGLTVMMIGGSALGTVRHKGFIPWDDDLDVAMTRADYEKLKTVFDAELGDRYRLCGAGTKEGARNRFPVMLVRGTRLWEVESSEETAKDNIKLDIFLIENAPQGSLHRKLKGLWCTALMFIASRVETYEGRNNPLADYMKKTEEGRKAFNARVRTGRLFAFRSYQQWLNTLDRAFQYSKETDWMVIPSGREHYFGEVLPRSVFVPASEGSFEGLQVKLPADPAAYLKNLYGPDYMTPPPVEKRERHFILDIGFAE